MKIRVLGCSGGVGKGVATTSFLVDDDILIDAGTGVCDLSLTEMRKIRHVFITHSHLDHIASIPLLADTLFDDLIGNPLTVHAQRSTIKVLRDHIFNWSIWPDFTSLPHKTNAVLKFQGMKASDVETVKGRKVEMITVNHAVPGVGYRVESKGKAFAFSGDTTNNENLWSVLNKHRSLDLLFIESAFSNKDLELARVAFHYCPELLAKDLPKLKHKAKVCISHLKPGEEKIIMKQCRAALPEWDLQQLKSGDIFEI
jgi:ribonuclease BN (tRNA processing enzyme)